MSCENAFLSFSTLTVEIAAAGRLLTLDYVVLLLNIEVNILSFRSMAIT